MSLSTAIGAVNYQKCPADRTDVQPADLKDFVARNNGQGVPNGFIKTVEKGTAANRVSDEATDFAPRITLSNATNEQSDQLPEKNFRSVTCHSKINNTRFLNKHFEAINRALLPGGTYIGCVETYEQFRGRLTRQYPVFLRYPYYLAHFFVKRFLPKWEPTRRLYFRINKGKNRSISLPEVLGRLVSCGFEAVEYREIDGLTWYAARKVREPHFDPDPTYGAIVRLHREGYHGRLITIYKLRTMHPYAEYIQEYAFRQNGLDRGDKIKDDFRVTSWGRALRKYWLDEFPMLWNYLRRDIKLVGVRPLSAQKLSLYRPELRELRRKVKPGLIPPYYADLPDSLEGMQQSETRYLEQYLENPWRTDARYLVKALYNIIIRRARSR